MPLPFLLLPSSGTLKRSVVEDWLRTNGIFMKGLAEKICQELNPLEGFNLVEDEVTLSIKGANSINFMLSKIGTQLVLSANFSHLSIDLHQTKEELDALSVYSRSLNHDLRTPLQNIYLQAELISMQSAENLDSIKKGAASIKEAAFTSQNIVEELSEFSKLKRADDTSCDLNEVFLHCKKLLEEDIVAANATIAHGVFHKIQASPFRLLVVLKNLLQNALKYGDSKRPQIILMDKIEGDEYVFSVLDNGIGVPKEDQEFLFQPYHRASNVGSRPGTGVGLATCYSIVASYGGSISVKSPVNGHLEHPGSKFDLTFPKSMVIDL
jgi:signal transduction histidine kinase